MYVEERRLHILELLKKDKRVDVSALAVQLDTSAETIRRDLNELEAEGFLVRTYGGAIYLGEDKSRQPIPFLPRQEINHEKKMRLAEIAARHVEPGDVIAIDNSTTAGCMIEYIPAHYRITVITYSLQLVLAIVSKPKCRWTCISLGGMVEVENMSTHGLLTNNAVGFFNPKKLFMSCTGIDPTGLMTEGNLLESEIKRELLQNSQTRFLLIDDTKLGQVGVVNEGHISQMNFLITNATADRAKLSALLDEKTTLLFDDDQSMLRRDDRSPAKE